MFYYIIKMYIFYIIIFIFLFAIIYLNLYNYKYNNTIYNDIYNDINKPYLWQYWDNIDGNNTPAYISLCLKTVDINCSDNFNIIRLNKNNIFRYLPELKPLKNILNNLIIQHKVDIYRIILLYKFGGLYLDADTICLRDPIEVIYKLNNYDFVGFGCTGAKCTDGYGKPSNWIMAARQNSILMNRCTKSLLEKIVSGKKFEYHELGKQVLWEQINYLIKSENYKYYQYKNKIDGSRDRNGNWITNEIVFSNTKIDYNDENNMLFYVFYNNSLPNNNIKKMNKSELLSKNWNYTKYIKKGLKIK